MQLLETATFSGLAASWRAFSTPVLPCGLRANVVSFLIRLGTGSPLGWGFIGLGRWGLVIDSRRQTIKSVDDLQGR